MTPSGAAPDRDRDARVRGLTRRDALALSASLGAAVLLSACYGFSGGGGSADSDARIFPGRNPHRNITIPYSVKKTDSIDYWTIR